MSGFLERLGTKLDIAPAIRPRVMSRFESASPFVDAIAPDATAGELVDNALDAPTRHLSATPSDAESARASLRDTPVAAPRATMNVAVDTIDGERRDSLDTGARRAAPDDRVLTATRTVSTAPLADSSVPLSSAAPPVRGTLDAAPIAQRPTFSAPAEGAAAAPRARTRLSPVIADAPGQVGTSREPDVVRVHIGRVEVRAILPAARPTPRQTTAPSDARPMTLDRYLSTKDRT